MIIRIVFLLVSALFFSPPIFAQATRLHAGDDYTDTWAVTFGAAYTSTVLQHDESSANASYTSTGRRVRVADIRLSLTAMKEFFNNHTYSVTAQVLGGITDSKGSSGDNEQTRYEEVLLSTHFGGGVSLNYNMYALGFKLQPFVGVDLMSEQGELILNHANGAVDLNTIHQFDAQLAFLNLGIRAFDADVSLMSYFQLSMPQVLSETFTPLGRVNGGDITITSNTEITRSPVAFSMGFGYFF